jgi:hypothetical protein
MIVITISASALGIFVFGTSIICEKVTAIVEKVMEELNDV